MNHFYHLLGLTVASEIECPELVQAAATDAVDIRITLEHVPKIMVQPASTNGSTQIDKGIFQFLIDGVARYRVEKGRCIRIDPSQGASPGDVRLYLLGMSMGALLHQRGLLPLHVCAVALNGEVQAFCGASGAGKSTLAAALHRRGLPLLCDDVGVAVPDAEGGVLFYPGFPRIKLWRDALDHFGINDGSLTRDLSGSDKFHLMLHETFRRQPLPLRRLYDLEQGDALSAPQIEPVTRHQAIGLLIANTYRPEMIRRVGDAKAHLRQCAQVANAIDVFRYVRPWRLDRLDEALKYLMNHMSGKVD